MNFDPGAKKTILAVDDAPENLDVVKAILVPEYMVKVATSGAQALKIAQTQAPDLILLDVMMPGMDGFEVCRQLKTQDATRAIPVMFVTAKDQTDDEAQGLALGAVDYIAKPIKPSILRARVASHIALADAVKQLTAQNSALIEVARLREEVEHITRHDLKAPLNVLIGVPELLLHHGSLSEDQQSLVRMLLEAAYRMLGMINRSLDLYKMESGVYAFNPKSIDLHAVMISVFSEFGAALADKGLRTRFTRQGQALREGVRVEALGEGLLCHSMFANLCKNAIEAAPEGDEIWVNYERLHSESGPMIGVTIDNGGETPLSVRDRFFQKFATAGKPDGTGLGAYSAMLIAKTHQGDIILDTSTPGRTRLRVTLPAASAEEISP